MVYRAYHTTLQHNIEKLFDIRMVDSRYLVGRTRNWIQKKRGGKLDKRGKGHKAKENHMESMTHDVHVPLGMW